MADAKRELEALLGQGKVSAGQLTGATRKALGVGTPAEKLMEEVLPPVDATETTSPLRAYFLFDTTGSMGVYINKARDCIESVGNTLFNDNKGIEVVVLGAGDHCDYALLRNSGVRMMGDYGQLTDATTKTDVLKSNIARIKGTSGGDTPEAYECAAYDLAQMMQGDKITSPKRKQVAIFFGDAMPHKRKEAGDDGCPNQRGAEQLTVLATVADHVYFVDCSSFQSSTRFRDETYGPVQDSQKTTYLKFDEAESVLPQVISAMVVREQSKVGYRALLASMSDGDRTKVAGFLGDGRK